MLVFHRWQSRTALLIVLGMTSTAAFPALIASPATAGSEPYIVGQVYSQTESFTVPSGTAIPVRYDEAEKIVVTPNETTPVTLKVAEDIRSASGAILIAKGSQIKGNLRPTRRGTQFVARELILTNSNQRLPIQATSRVITERETLKKGADTGNILKGAAIGAAAAAAISEVFGSIDVAEVLGGAGAGAIAGLLFGSRRETEVIVVRPETDLNLTLQSDLQLY